MEVPGDAQTGPVHVAQCSAAGILRSESEGASVLPESEVFWVK